MNLLKVSDGTTSALTVPAETTLLDTGNVKGYYACLINVANLVAGDEIELVAYTKVLSGDGYAVAWRANYANVQDQLVIESPRILGLYGVKFTINQLTGTGRTFKWSVIQVDAPVAVASIATDAVDAASIKADAGAELAAALLDLTNGIESGLTPRQALRLILSSAAGKLSGAGTATETFRNVGDTKDRITATVDASGNRSAVTTDGT